MEEYNKLRKLEFKGHEVEKEFNRRKKLEEMNEVNRKIAEEQHLKNLEKRNYFF